MPVFRIISPTESYLFNREMKSVSGILFIQIDSIDFPCFEWTDLVISCLCMWLENISKMAAGKTNDESFFFMDGRYFFRLNKLDDGYARIKLCTFDEELSSCDGLRFRDICVELLKTANAALKRLENARFARSVILSLKKAIRQVEAIVE